MQQSAARFFEHLDALCSHQPSQEELEISPELCRWVLVCRDGSQTPFLVGYALGHPDLRWGARISTSPVFQLQPENGWARTWSRVYLLSEYVPGTLLEMQRDGVISAKVRLISMNLGEDHSRREG